MYNALPKDNQFFVGAIWIAVIGGLTTFLYYLVQNIYEFCTRYVIIKVSLDNKTEVFEWILRWLSVNKSVFSAQNLAIRVSRTTKTKWWKENSDEKPNVEILPGPGDHLFYYQGHLVWLNRTQSDKVTTTGWQRKPFIFESLTLSTLGRDQKIFSDLFMEAQKFCTVQDSSETKIYILSDDGDEWLNVLKKKPRALETVILDTTLANELITDAKDFFTKQEWYVDRGIPYRRGYLLYGPPGNGKTSFIQSLAGELKLDICVLGLSSNSLDDQSLNQRLHEVPANAIILLEDVDAVFVNRNTAEGMSDSGKKRVTFSNSSWVDFFLYGFSNVLFQEGSWST
jgi:chaperone BCS1